MKNSIYYFSGTGNSYSIARELSNSLQDCELIPIARIWKNNRITIKAENVGLIFPLYYWGLPHIVYEFATKLNLDNSTYIYAVVTRAGDVNGIPLIQLEQLLNKKSKKLQAGFFIQMPNNYILGYNVNSEAQNQVLFKRAKSKITEILTYIKEQKGNIKPNLSQQLDPRTNDLNRNFRETVMESDNKFYVDEKCTSCGICEQVCPVNNIKIIEGKPKWLHQCQQCLACINYCPEEAIQYGNKTLTTGRYFHPEVDTKTISLQQQIK